MSKTIIVTGGAGGIGSDICRGMGADGLNVVVADYAKDAAKKLRPKFAIARAVRLPYRSMSAIPRASLR